jgi:hypothetical protein
VWPLEAFYLHADVQAMTETLTADIKVKQPREHADGTQAVDVPLKNDDFWRWDADFDYQSNGCIKLTPTDLKELFSHLDKAGWPKNLTLQVS